MDLPFAREIFIRRGLVDGDFPRPPPEVRANNALLDALRRRAEKTRRPELFDAERLCAHFAAVLPPDVASAPALVKWLRRADAAALARFALKKADWWPAEDVPDADFPETLTLGGARMALSYRNAPDDPETDGITCTARLRDAAALRLWRADWLVPGALPEKLAYLLSALPSAQRRILQPVEDVVAGLLSRLRPGAEPLLDAVRRAINEEWGLRVAPEAWANLRLPPHLRVRFCIRDDATGRVLAASRDLDAALSQAGLAPSRAPSVQQTPAPLHATSWVFGTLPEKTTDAKAGWTLEHFPALHDDGDQGVSLHLFADARTAAASHAAGVTRLFLLALDGRARPPFRRKSLPLAAQLYLDSLAYDDARLAADLLAGAVRETFVRNLPPVRDAAAFDRRLAERRDTLGETLAEMTRLVGAAFAAAAAVDDRMEAVNTPPETADSVRTQLAWLLYRGFPRTVPLARLRHYARYLKGAAVRVERARTNPSGDLSKERRLAPYWQLYADAATGASKVKFDPSSLVEIRWLIEEYRVSLFAQELRTAEPVSPQRLDAKLAAAVID